MTKFIFDFLEKTGNWFGIIFKIILPVAVMYRPIKMFTLSFVTFGTLCGGDFQGLNRFGVVLFYILYGVFVAMLFLTPKAASAAEFILIINYFICLGLFYYIDFFRSHFADMQQIARTYSQALPWVIIFLSGKVFFFFFMKAHPGNFGGEIKKKSE